MFDMIIRCEGSIGDCKIKNPFAIPRIGETLPYGSTKDIAKVIDVRYDYSKSKVYILCEFADIEEELTEGGEETPTPESLIEDADLMDRIISIAAEQLMMSKSDINISSDFKHDLHADSLDTVELCMAFEEEFGFEIPDEKAEMIKTIQNVYEYFKEQLDG